MTTNGSRLWALALLPLALAACGGGGDSAAEGEDGGAVTETTDSAAAATMPVGSDTMAMAGAGGQLTDANVAAVLSVADSGEIRPSQAAQQQAQNAQVKEYAQMMVTEHGMLEDSLRALTGRLGVTPAPNALSQQLRTQADSAMQALQGQTGANFDRAYMQWMVASHQATLTAIDSQLMPAIQNAEMRTAVQQQVRPRVEQHLQRAQQIQSSLGGAQ
jgi:putative membrane protein